MKRQSVDWEEARADNTATEGLISKMHRQLMQLRFKNPNVYSGLLPTFGFLNLSCMSCLCILEIKPSVAV